MAIARPQTVGAGRLQVVVRPSVLEAAIPAVLLPSVPRTTRVPTAFRATGACRPTRAGTPPPSVRAATPTALIPTVGAVPVTVHVGLPARGTTFTDLVPTTVAVVAWKNCVLLFVLCQIAMRPAIKGLKAEACQATRPADGDALILDAPDEGRHGPVALP